MRERPSSSSDAVVPGSAPAAKSACVRVSCTRKTAVRSAPSSTSWDSGTRSPPLTMASNSDSHRAPSALRYAEARGAFWRSMARSIEDSPVDPFSRTTSDAPRCASARTTDSRPPAQAKKSASSSSSVPAARSSRRSPRRSRRRISSGSSSPLKAACCNRVFHSSAS